MNGEQVSGNWKPFEGKVREPWCDPTDGDLERVAGRRDRLVGVIRERYGIAKEEAEDEAAEWERMAH
jgi:uncharacterized protein YjbJ (UPF0337 family)